MSIYYGDFQPHKLAGTQLYYQRKDSSASLCPDYSPNGYDLTQAVAAQQPTLGVDSINFDGSNDFISRSVTNPFIAHTQGTFHFSINAVSGVLQRVFVVNNTLTPSGNNQFQIFYTADNKIRLAVRNVDRTIEVIFETVNTFGTGYLYGSISSNGSSYTLKVNGVVQAITFVAGSDTGAWLSSVTTTNVIRIGLLTSVSNFYAATRLNKLYYNNGTLSAIDQWKIEQFFANPLNYI